MFRRKNVFYAVGFLIVFFLSSCKIGYGQHLVEANPADLWDPHSNFVNPAVMSFQNSQLLLGAKVFHPGFLNDDAFAFKNWLLGLSFPKVITSVVGTGITGQFFDAPIYREGRFSVLLSGKPHRALSIGFNLNLLTKSFNREEFNLVDAGDPVFANGTSRTAFSIGTGLLFAPIANIAIGFSVDHLNRPDVSLSGDDERQTSLTEWGVSYSIGNVRSVVGFSIFRGDFFHNISLGYYWPEFGFLRIGHERDAVIVMGQLYIANGMSLNYTCNYPTSEIRGASAGLHQISIIYNLRYKLLPF